MYIYILIIESTKNNVTDLSGKQKDKNGMYVCVLICTLICMYVCMYCMYVCMYVFTSQLHTYVPIVYVS